MISYTTFSFFIIYFGITFVIYCLMPQKAKWCVLLLGSLIFYFISSKGHILLLLISSFIIYFSGLGLQKINEKLIEAKKHASKDEKKTIKKKYSKQKYIVTALSVTALLSLLLISKYSGFFAETVSTLFPVNIKGINIIQPLGISFFTLQAISYTVDVYNGKTEAERNPFKLLLYLTFMLTVVEGPIARYDTLGKQFNECKNADLESLSKGFTRVLWGLFKKIVIADRAVMLVSAVFDNSQNYSGGYVVLAILFYTLQLYCEFSGVMDMVCGLGQMMGLTLPKNFNHPFFAKSINEFWQRWHISLGSFLRDYIFYPLAFSGGIRALNVKTREKFNSYYANLIPTSVALFFVWFANGFWHGSGWKYIVYGLYYYILMMFGIFLEPLFEKIYLEIHLNRKSKAFSIFQKIRTLLIVCIGMLIFRADNLKTAGAMVASIFKATSGKASIIGLNKYDYAIIAIGVIALIAVAVIEEKGINIKEKIYCMPYPLKASILMCALFSIIVFGAYGEGYGVVDLIYAGF